VYDEYFSTIVHVGGSFRLGAAIDYADDCNPDPELLKLYSCGCGLRTVVPRFEYCSFWIAEPVKKTLYVRRGTPYIVPLLANVDYNENGREYNETKGKSSKESNDESDLEFLGDLTQDIEYENDAAFFRESDLFDDDLDRRLWHYDETCSKLRRKGSYARHGVEFKFRKATSYGKSSSNDATDNVLSESDVFVDEIFHIKISPNWTRRTKEKALKKINGDHLNSFNSPPPITEVSSKAQHEVHAYVDFT
ncbi:hypothetical protein Leryth_025513, partial [Lithospermum erythrorhizon]